MHKNKLQTTQRREIQMFGKLFQMNQGEADSSCPVYSTTDTELPEPNNATRSLHILNLKICTPTERQWCYIGRRGGCLRHCVSATSHSLHSSSRVSMLFCACCLHTASWDCRLISCNDLWILASAQPLASIEPLSIVSRGLWVLSLFHNTVYKTFVLLTRQINALSIFFTTNFGVYNKAKEMLKSILIKNIDKWWVGINDLIK